MSDYFIATEVAATTAVKRPDGSLLVKASIIDDRVREFDGAEIGQEAGKVYKVRRSMEALTQPETLKSLESAPLFINHHDNVSIENLNNLVHGYPVGAAKKLNDRTIGIDYVLSSAEAVKAYEEGKRELSPSYRFRLTEASPGSNYEYSMHSVSAEHIAIVDAGANGPSIRLQESKKVSDEIKISEEDKKSIVASVIDGVKEWFKKEEKETKIDEKQEFTKAEHDAELKKVQDFYNDKLLVQPLLVNEKAKETIDKVATTSQMVLGMTLGMSKEDAEKESVEVLRGRVQERLASKKESGSQEDESLAWENVNKVGNDGKDEPTDFYSLEEKRYEKLNKARQAS